MLFPASDFIYLFTSFERYQEKKLSSSAGTTDFNFIFQVVIIILSWGIKVDCINYINQSNLYRAFRSDKTNLQTKILKKIVKPNQKLK